MANIDGKNKILNWGKSKMILLNHKVKNYKYNQPYEIKYGFLMSIIDIPKYKASCRIHT